MRKRLLKFFISFSIIVVILINLSTILRDFIEVYNFNVSHFSLKYFIKVLMSKETYINYFKIIDPPNGASWILIGMYFVYSMFDIFGGINNSSKFIQNEKYGSHGTSRWQTSKEIKKYYYNNNKIGWFLGHTKLCNYQLNKNYAYHSNNGDLNMQINVVGAPGSNKTTGFVYPNIFHIANIYSKLKEHADLIITDPKSELYSQTASFLESKGYEIKVLDFIHLKYGDKLNILDFIHDDKQLMEVSHGYVKSVSAIGGSISSEQEFWDQQESQVLAALIGFIKQKLPKQNQTLTELTKILTCKDVSSIEDARKFFIKNNIKGAPNQLWNNFLMISDSDRTRANILGGLSTKLKLFAIEGVQNITSMTTIDIDKLGAKKDKPIALFILMPDGDRTFSPIINTIVTTLFNQLYKTAYKYNNKLANPVYFILEEAANIGYIPGLQEKLGTMRGRRIYPMMIWQSLAQMKDRYPKGWEDILSMCDTHVYLGVNDEFTAKYVSNQLGATTIKVQGISQRENGAYKGGKSQSLNYQQRKLLFEDEIMRFDTKTSIVVQRGRYPAKLKKVQYKYWEDKYRICTTKRVDKLPLLSPHDNIDIKIADNINVDDVIEKKHEHISEKRDKFSNSNTEKTLINNENTELDKDLELDISVIEDLEKELQKDR